MTELNAERYMRRALELAIRARGHTSPNPAVGAVLVRDGVIVGEGCTQPPGQAHAEICALAQAGDAARGATLFVTLEPCCHHGRTGPCTEAIIAAGVRAVYYATLDPNPLVSGKGIAQLEAAGIATFGGPLAEQARELIEGFAYHVRYGRPLVIAKWAMTLDGKIATVTGDSRWISGEASRQWVHALRGTVDAIMVGVGTALADDPQLTNRLPSLNGSSPRQPLRVVVDSQLQLPPAARMLDEPGTTLVATLEASLASHRDRRTALEHRGAELLGLPADEAGHVDLAALLNVLGQRGCVDVLVEGGATLLGSLLDRGLVDKAVAFVAPKLVGGSTAPTPIAGRGVQRMSDAVQLRDRRVEVIDGDVMVVGYLNPLSWPERDAAEPLRSAASA